MHCNKIYAYEPFRENYDLLMMNIKSNDLGAKISASRKAIDGKTCKRRLYLDPRSNAGHSLVKESGRWNVVNCITLEELFSENQIESCDLLKLDCEGSEKDVVLTFVVRNV